MNKKLKLSIGFNIALVIMVIFATICMFTGFTFMGNVMLLSVTKIEMFKFFTVDSNILLGICALIMVIFEIKVLKGKIEEIPSVVYKLKLAGTVGVTLTFLVTAFYLAPFSVYNYFDFFKNSNLFFHFIVPVVSIISFVFLENTNKLKFSHSFLGIIPVFIYAIYYVANILIHLENGMVSYTYDFYGFAKGKTSAIFVSAIIVFSVSYLISFILWKTNKKLYKGE